MKVADTGETASGYLTCGNLFERDIVRNAVLTLSLMVVAAASFRPNEDRTPVTGMCDTRQGTGIRGDITCRDVDLTMEADRVMLFEHMKSAAKHWRDIDLTLKNFKYPNGTLENNWFCQIHFTRFKILSLTIEYGLSLISNRSLKCLDDLEVLTLVNTDLSNLTKTQLRPVNLLRLELRSNPRLRNVEPGLIADMHRLETLQVQGLFLPPEDSLNLLHSFSGGRPSPKVTTIDWSNNNLKVIPRSVLSAYTGARQVIIQSSEVRRFEPGAFDKLTKLEKLVIVDNQMESFPEREYRRLVERLPALYVRRNPIICDCDMLWLQHFIRDKKSGKYGDFREIRCAGPPHLANVLFLDAELCPNTTDCPVMKIKCASRHGNGSMEVSLSAGGRVIVRDGSVEIPRERQNFTIVHDESAERLVVHIHNPEGFRKSVLYWRNTVEARNESRYNCLTDVKTEVDFPASHDSDFTVCVLDAFDDVSVLDCRTLRTEKKEAMRTWLTNGMKPQVYALSAVAMVGAMTFGGVFVYFLFRHNPALLRGSKRVINVKRYKKSPVIVLPKGYSVKEDGRRDGDRASEASYISAIPPEPSEMILHQLQRSRRHYPIPM